MQTYRASPLLVENDPRTASQITQILQASGCREQATPVAIQAQSLHLPVIAVAEKGKKEDVIQAIRLGALD